MFFVLGNEFWTLHLKPYMAKKVFVLYETKIFFPKNILTINNYFRNAFAAAAPIAIFHTQIKRICDVEKLYGFASLYS